MDTYVYHNPFTEVVIVRDGLEVGYASELGVGGVPVLFLAADFGQRPEGKGNRFIINCIRKKLYEYINLLLSSSATNIEFNYKILSKYIQSVSWKIRAYWKLLCKRNKCLYMGLQ